MQEKIDFELIRNDKEILFSIIVPVYNAENYIDECIKSVMYQNVSEWELLLVNDGSTDKSGKICHHYADVDTRIRVIDQENSGQFAARRVAIQLAKGKYTVFLDSDDFLESMCLSKLKEVLDKHSPDILMYTGYLYYENDNKKKMEVSFQEGFVDKEKIYRKIVCSDELNAIWTKCLKTSLLQEDPTDYSVYYGNSYGEDKLQFFYPITCANTVYYLPVPLYNYRQVPNSIIHNLDVSLIEKKLHLDVWNALFVYAKKWGLWSTKDKKLIGAYYLRHMISTFSIIYDNADRQNKKKCLRFDWKGNIPQFVVYNRSSMLLTKSEKAKLFCMRHSNNLLLNLKSIIRRS